MKHHKRARKKHGWNCLGCGALLHRHLAEQARRDLSAVTGAGPPIELVHICSRCHTPHMAGPAGLRRPSVAEQFQIEMQCGSALRLLEIGLLGGAPGTATLVLPGDPGGE